MTSDTPQPETATVAKTTVQAPALGRFRTLYQRCRAKGKWFLLGFILFYLIRDTILYIVLPYYAAKGGIFLWDDFFGR